MAKRIKRDWHPVFKKYMEFIAKHPNYAGMPFLYKKDSSIRWVVTRGSEAGQARLKWWDKKRKELGLPKGDAWISKTARAIHPTGEKPCQICGKVMSLDYVYQNKRNTMSPGAMSNAPDRLDGYHTYNLCCRGKQDTGRHKSNLARYGEDRRAYENWSEGDWKAASWLMKEFQKHGVSPDHLGPISLGFSHRPKFRPLTRAANSARNNRMTLADIKLLLQEEMAEPVISSHSKHLWDLLKNEVTDNEGALKLGKLMRENMHHVLSIFSYLAENGHKDFLIKNFLHPEYADYSIKFEDFDPETGIFKKMVKINGTKKQYANNAKRYIRISLDSLKQYSLKKNRNLKKWLTDEIAENLSQVIKHLERGNEKKALACLFETFEIVAKNLAKKF
ncbi:MAG: hypothetical protein COV70_01975 [Parcubacteria group bacterium CG11_big_fil_rev_8_21_14_0_20_39_22]|nr:MAG: hypothetical protein COV70_01975 [Parcubacteria group bacterium CG11_big_fil_rev_8_21_14_0_20_39_22]